MGNTYGKLTGTCKTNLDSFVTPVGSAASEHLGDPLVECDPWAMSMNQPTCGLVEEASINNAKVAIDAWASWKPQCYSSAIRGLELHQIFPRHSTDVAMEVDIVFFSSMLHETDISLSPFARNDPINRQSDAQRKGGWRALSEDGFRALYSRFFPANHSGMRPHEYVQLRWPSHRMLKEVWSRRKTTSRHLRVGRYRRMQCRARRSLRSL